MPSQTRVLSLALLTGTLLLGAAAGAQSPARPPADSPLGIVLSQPIISAGLPFPRQPIFYSIRLENPSDRFIPAPAVELVVPTGLVMDAPAGGGAALEPGGAVLRRWTVTAERPGVYPVQLRIRSEGGPARTITTQIVVAREPRNLDTRGDRHPHVKADDEGNLVFRNERLVAVLQKSDTGYGPVLLYPATRTSTARATPVALVPFVAQVGEGAPFQPTQAKISGDDRVRLHAGDLEAELSINDEPWLSWRVRGGPAGPLRAMPLLTLGEGPRQALFPGVEWVDGAQPAPLREPDPYAVTVPLMVVSRFETIVGQLWNPRQYAGGYPRPLFGGDESGTGSLRMELSLPEGSAASGRRELSGKILVLPFENNPVAAVRQWVRAYGQPEAGEAPRSREAARKLARAAYTKTLWNPEFNGWSPALDGEKALPPVQDAFPALALLMEAGLTGGRERAELRAQAERVIAELRKRGPLEPPLAYRAGGVLPSLSAERERLQETVDDQLAGGGWPWESLMLPTDGEPLGDPGETALGIVTARALPILRYAAWTGDSTMAGSGRKALEFIDRTFRVPRGSHLFAFPLHAPSLLAAAEAAECFMLGYQVTGELRYVESARRWADAALTFIYFWGEKEKPALMHAGRLSYGSEAPEADLGAQQWAALTLARVLQGLSDIQPDGLYDNVSEGIVASAIHQQFASGPQAGLLPLFWDLRANQPDGLALAPRPLLEAIYPLEHHWTGPSHVRLRIGSDRMFAAGGAYLYRPWASSTRIRLNLRGVEGQDAFLTLTGVPDRPLSVEYNSSNLRHYGIPVSRSFLPEAREETEPGWNYDPTAGLLVLRLRHTGGEDHLEIRWPDPKDRTPIARVDTRVRTRR